MGLIKLFKRATALAVMYGAIVTDAAPSAVDNLILVFAGDQYVLDTATSGLEGYGIPYEGVIVPKEGITLPSLNSSETEGNYGGFIVMNALSYEYEGGNWRSALTDEQWDTIYAYQSDFNVRLVRVGDTPGISTGRS